VGVAPPSQKGTGMSSLAETFQQIGLEIEVFRLYIFLDKKNV
jgi:hypothetical protein